MADATRTDTPPSIPQALVGLAFLAMLALFAALVFVPAGRLDWTLGWIYVDILAVSVAVDWACLLRWNPELIDRRRRFGEGTKTWDKVWSVLFAPVTLAIYVVAGLEARDGVSSLPVAAWPLGLVIFVPGAALFTWSMVVTGSRIWAVTPHVGRVAPAGVASGMLRQVTVPSAAPCHCR